LSFRQTFYPQSKSGGYQTRACGKWSFLSYKENLIPTMLLQKLKNSIFVQIFIIYTRYLIGGAFVFASIVKIKGERFMTDLRMIDEAPIHSAGHLFETLYQSGLYWKFIGIGQLVAAFLLMTQRFSKLGALVFFPIMLNIFFITASYDFAGTIYITSLMLLANVALLVWDWGELKTLFNLYPPEITHKNSFEKMKIWELCGLTLFAFTAIWRLFVTNSVNLIIWVIGCLMIGIIFLIIGIRQSKRLA
jgi:hypothetical protein